MRTYFTVFFLVFMIFMAMQRIWETFFRKKGKKGKIIKKWTFPVLCILHFAVGIGTVVEYFLIRRDIKLYITILGLTMFFSALLLRTWVIKTLGEYHSLHIEIREDHPLITKGPYQYVRHPYYLSVIFELLGFPIVANAYYSFLFSLFIYVPFLLIRVHFEEKAMIEKFGTEYIRYMSRIRGFLPIRTDRNL